jgi:RNA polymerase sigma-70 factor (ECF subfamily)
LEPVEPLAQLFREHYVELVRFVERFDGDRARAEDLVQDVFAKLWAGRARWKEPANVRAYLFAAVRNRMLDARRRDRVERDWVARQDSAEIVDAASGSEIVDEFEEDARRLELAWASLPERCRLIMHLRWRAQLSHREIADVAGVSVKAVENQLARGLRLLRRALGVSRSGDAGGATPA